jgi:hypothetical protein
MRLMTTRCPEGGGRGIQRAGSGSRRIRARRARFGLERALAGSRVERHPTMEEQHEHPCPLYRSARHDGREVRRDVAPH